MFDKVLERLISRACGKSAQLSSQNLSMSIIQYIL